MPLKVAKPMDSVRANPQRVVLGTLRRGIRRSRSAESYRNTACEQRNIAQARPGAGF